MARIAVLLVAVAHKDARLCWCVQPWTERALDGVPIWKLSTKISSKEE
jgi:hypothetical protein